MEDENNSFCCTVREGLDLKCQFEGFLPKDEEFFKKSGEHTFCIFHLDGENKFIRLSSKANSILSCIQNGKLHYGNLEKPWADYSYVALPEIKISTASYRKTVASVLDFTGCNIKGKVEITDGCNKFKEIKLSGSSIRQFKINSKNSAVLQIHESSLSTLDVEGSKFSEIKIVDTSIRELNLKGLNAKEFIFDNEKLTEMEVMFCKALAIEKGSISNLKLVSANKSISIDCTIVQSCIFKECKFEAESVGLVLRKGEVKFESCGFTASKDINFKFEDMSSAKFDKTSFNARGMASFMFPESSKRDAILWVNDVSFDCKTKFKPASGASSNAKFTKAKFENTAFNHEVCFELKEDPQLDLQSCTFVIAPDFTKTVIGSNVNMPKITSFKQHESTEAENRYQYLYHSFIKINNHDYAGIFYALYKRAQRKNSSISANIPTDINVYKYFGLLIKNAVEKSTSFLYDTICHYGTNYARPLILFLLCPFIFSFLYYNSTKFFYLSDALYFSIQQIVRPFSVWNQVAGDVSNKSLHYLSLFQSIISILLFALFLLAIRWRFKRN